jgi:hypothetical protein
MKGKICKFKIYEIFSRFLIFNIISKRMSKQKDNNNNNNSDLKKRAVKA